MEWITVRPEDDRQTAPRRRPGPIRDLLASYFEQLREAMATMAQHGIVHGDLSAYNLLAAGERLVIIDLPQVIDLVGNPQGMDFLLRDCANVCALVPQQGTRPGGGGRARAVQRPAGHRVLEAAASARSRARRSRRTTATSSRACGPPAVSGAVCRAAWPSPWKVCLRTTGSAPRYLVSTASRHGTAESRRRGTGGARDVDDAVRSGDGVAIAQHRHGVDDPHHRGLQRIARRGGHHVQVEGDVGLEAAAALAGQADEATPR